MSITENLKKIYNNIQDVCNNSGRDSQDVLLIAVTKTVGVEEMKEAIENGILAVGENKPQELKKKYEIINDKVRWHMIGSLQTNKVKYIIDKVDMIHSLDRDSLCEEIQKRAESIDRYIDCLVQVNISREDSKHGLFIEDVLPFVENCSKKYDRINIKGLMTIAPADASREEVRAIFKDLKNLSREISNKSLSNVEMKELSMGMSGDYDIAIEEGATMIRVGTSIFGERNYNL